MSAADIVASAREFADGLDVSLTEAGNARIHIARLADTIEQLITDLDARFEHSDHQSAKYYQRMRAAEKETRMRRSESADFERERDEAGDIETRLAELLWNLTDGRMSGTGYDVPTMVAEVEAAFERAAQGEART